MKERKEMTRGNMIAINDTVEWRNQYANKNYWSRYHEAVNGSNCHFHI